MANQTAEKKDDFIWAALLHFGMNMWCDQPVKAYKDYTPEELDLIAVADHLRFDEAVWRKVTGRMAEVGMNMVVIDVGEGILLKSHPELSVKGSWTIDRFRAELDRLRRMGLEPIPKLNFSAAHDTWLKDYGRMLSTPEYYRVCEDVIAEVGEIFDRPRFFHLGYDEENWKCQRLCAYAVVRQGEQWWRDFLKISGFAEKHGMRPWIWSDYAWDHDEEFLRRMPKSVVQSPWWYIGVLDPEKNVPTKAIVRLAKLGYDVVPCSSNCYSHPEAMKKLVEFCRKTFDPKYLLGFQMAPWLEMNDVFEKRWGESADQLASAKAAFESL